MKLIALTLAISILSMAFLPSLSVIIPKEKTHTCQSSSCHKTCCKSQVAIKNTEKKKHKNDCSKGGCTPFMGCCNIQFFSSPINISENIPVTEKIKFHLISEIPNNRYFDKYWRPPQVA